DYADGEMPSQTDPSPLTGFAVPSNIGVFDAYSRRSVIVVNDESSFSVIGSSTDSRQIVATRIVPFRANAGVLIDASASGSTWHGGEARLRVVLDNQIPEDSFAALAVAHEPVLRLRSEEHTSELQSRENLVCRLLLEKKKKNISFMFICFQQ